MKLSKRHNILKFSLYQEGYSHLGFEEVVKFFQKATKEEEELFDFFASHDRIKDAWRLVNTVVYGKDFKDLELIQTASKLSNRNVKNSNII